MQMRVHRGLQPLSQSVRFSQSRERGNCAQQHLRVLPVRTRPSLFGGD